VAFQGLQETATQINMLALAAAMGETSQQLTPLLSCTYDSHTRMDRGRVRFLDQTKLPLEETYVLAPAVNKWRT
jgi:hypothetical protein